MLICQTQDCFLTWVYSKIHKEAEQLKTEEFDFFVTKQAKSILYFPSNLKDRDFRRYLDTSQQYPFDCLGYIQDDLLKQKYGQLVAFEGPNKHVEFFGEQKQARMKSFIENFLQGRLGDPKILLDKIFEFERQSLIFLIKKEDTHLQQEFI